MRTRQILERFRAASTPREADTLTEAERVARGVAAVAAAAALLGYEKGLRWVGRRGRCLWFDREYPRREPPHAVIRRAYAVAWTRGSAAAMGRAKPDRSHSPKV